MPFLELKSDATLFLFHNETLKLRTAGTKHGGLGWVCISRALDTHFSFCSQVPWCVSGRIHPLDCAHAVIPVRDLVCRELKHNLGKCALDSHLLQADGHI